uniref:Putative secreted protein n=1 Tax=Anopheles marajoara TaxID=58244 RepID=A0A2M4CEV4_9DIPT
MWKKRTAAAAVAATGCVCVRVRVCVRVSKYARTQSSESIKQPQEQTKKIIKKRKRKWIAMDSHDVNLAE